MPCKISISVSANTHHSLQKDRKIVLYFPGKVKYPRSKNPVIVFVGTGVPTVLVFGQPYGRTVREASPTIELRNILAGE